jgi:hypothetical protein
MKTILFAFIALFFSFSGVSLLAQKNENREVKDFKEIAVAGKFIISLRQGSNESLRLEGSEEDLSKIETDVSAGKLKIKVKNFAKIGEVKIFIEYKQMEEFSIAGSSVAVFETQHKSDNMTLEIAGSGDITGDFSVKNFEAEIAGSGKIHLKGNAEKQELSVAGSGLIESNEMKTLVCEVDIAGSGDVYVSPEKSLKAEIAGSGIVSYSGNPGNVEASVAGSGKIKKTN